jgi:hypothetical protein
MFVRYVRSNGISVDDVRWFINIVGYFKGHEHPSGKFNAGEKLVFWVVLVLLTTVLIITGLILVFPNFDQTRSTMQWANIVHMVAAYLSIALACVHIYLGTIGMKGAYDAMRYGYVDATWAEHHHKKWYDDVVAGRAPEKFVQPEACVRARLQPRRARGRLEPDSNGGGEMTTLRALAGAFMVLAAFGVAMAKLPAPPPLTDAQKVAAEEKKAKDATAAEIAKQQQARAEDRVAARYIAEQKAKGNSVTPQMGPASAAATAAAAPAATPGKAGATPAKAPEAAAPAKK